MKNSLTRRQSLLLLGTTLATKACTTPASEAAVRSESPAPNRPDWGRGYENQRIADRKDGTFLNPIFSGDRPDPSIIRDCDTYYLTFSSFDAYPGLFIWQSTDLVNWQPVGPALTHPIGSVWAPDLIKHGDRFYIYIPARSKNRKSIYVIYANQVDGPWSKPVDLDLPDHIDPAHAIGEDGKRYLFLSNGDLVELSDDGLSTVGDVEHIYDPWRYPDDWDVECFCPEGPKILRKDNWFYMLTAVGGTAGPPTGHMVIAARARSVKGPWQHAPNNPQVRTTDRSESWWSRGHATLIEGPAGDWWMISHGYENGFWTLGRQCLLEPIRWREDGWFESLGGDLSTPFPKPLPSQHQPHGLPLSDDFSTSSLGPQWVFYDPSPVEHDRIDLDGDGLRMTAKGETPADTSPLCVIPGDRAYEVTARMELDPGSRAGLLLFYNSGLYCGLSYGPEGLVMHRYGQERSRPNDLDAGLTHLEIKVRNDNHVVTFFTRLPGERWKKFDVQMEVSGYHHNTAYDFLSLRPGLMAAGKGHVRFSQFRYKALS